MNANQAIKLAHQLILLIIAFLDLLVNSKEKVNAYYFTARAASETVREQ